ncbi:hypothetical protein M758_3G096300 [Ceratodon purpureus]|uniref:Uncharacterized protein n=1 Tax=Ceratodon purpureus TaxID=3225 RepID=A0A8T0IK23_CERPU|nr:hypothetical protein KC19_3G093300 [Ceratodon purpureus]KAG0622424.1 hypothetical protein M758_3G096300 [Ceratodon purpureus]
MVAYFSLLLLYFFLLCGRRVQSNIGEGKVKSSSVQLRSLQWRSVDLRFGLTMRY